MITYAIIIIIAFIIIFIFIIIITIIAVVVITTIITTSSTKGYPNREFLLILVNISFLFQVKLLPPIFSLYCDSKKRQREAFPRSLHEGAGRPVISAFLRGPSLDAWRGGRP